MAVSFNDFSVLILIPAFRAESSLKILIPKLQEFWSGKILVIDDGSDDHTLSIVEELGEQCLLHAKNEGKGAALWTGMQAARSAGVEWVVCMDADGQHLPEDVQALLDLSEDALFKIGDRMGQAETMPWFRRRVNAGMSAWVNQRLKTKIPDTQCGLRIYHHSVLPENLPCFARFAFETEELFRLVQAGVNIESVPIACRYNADESHIRVWRDTIQFLKLMSSLPGYRLKSSGVPNGPAD